MRKFTGRLISLSFKDIEPIKGILLDYDDDWILLRSNPVDFILDGYCVVANRNLKKLRLGEKWTESVLKLKGRPTLKSKIPVNSLESMLRILTKKYGVFALRTKKRGSCWLGKLKSIDDKSLVIDDFTPRARWDGHKKFKVKDIRAVEFDTEYINSLKLVLTNRRRKRTS